MTRPALHVRWTIVVNSLLIMGLLSAIPGLTNAQTKKAASAKDRVKELESKAKQCRTAEEARLLYGLFMADEATTADEREAAQPQAEYWTQAAKDDLVRVGAKWMAAPRAAELCTEADKLVEEALQSLKLDDTEGAEKKLKKASAVYPDHLPSVYLLGVNACLNGKYDAAENHFQKCLARSPNNVGVLNNAAVCEVKNHKYTEAIVHWEKAANIDPDNVDVKLNLGNFVSAAAKQRLPKVDRPVIDRATKLFNSMTAKGKSEAAFAVRIETKTNVKSTPTRIPNVRPTVALNDVFVMSRLEQSKNNSIVEESQIVGNGSGFVIAPGYVLTNKHVVTGAQTLSIQPPEGGALLTAKVHAIANTDLALLECKELKSPPVPFVTVPAGRGTEVLAFGFPLTTVVGKGLKTTRGIITGLPEKANRNMYLLDVPVNPGNSGGPLCDQSGRIVGVVSAKTFSDTFTEGYGLAIPIAEAEAFVRSSLKDWEPERAPEGKLDWTEVDAKLSKSTVLILIWKKTN